MAQTEVKPAGREPTLKIGGLIQFQADFGDRGDSQFTTADDRFYLRRARLNAIGTFLEEFDFKVELELSGSLSNNSTSISTIKGHDLKLQMNYLHTDATGIPEKQDKILCRIQVTF